MKRFIPLCSALFLTLILTGCGSSGKNFPVVHVSEIKIGVTTQSQILDWFGIAYKEGMRNADLIWTYQFDTWSAFDQGKSKELVLLFDQNYVVKAYRYASNMDE